MRLALGMVETRGFAALFEAADAMLKRGNVTLVGWQAVGGGLVTAFIEGDADAVHAAAEAGAEAASRIGELIAVQMIEAPHESLPRFWARASEA